MPATVYIQPLTALVISLLAAVTLLTFAWFAILRCFPPRPRPDLEAPMREDAAQEERAGES
jgi:hypothetical protein